MKLYKITDPTPHGADGCDGTSKIKFVGTQADARKTRIEFEAPYKHQKKQDRPEITVEEVDVPTDKAGLIDFLNRLEA